MAGIYLHIPFCRSRCIYCGFYSTTALSQRQRYVDALCREMEMRRQEWQEMIAVNRQPHTIYLGGGTPSQLTTGQLSQLFNSLDSLTPSASEVTIECNPDDVTPDFARALRQMPVNRVSMGAQTMDDRRLKFLRRRHSSQQMTEAVRRLRQAGIGNISIDLIYGFPGETLAEWMADINAVLALGVEHISAYSLSYEESTPLHRLMMSGDSRYAPIDEELSLSMYETLIDRLSASGFEHYEISNFARKAPDGSRSLRSLHNSSYWTDVPYLGLGAAAHSYNLRSRRWNPSDIKAYMEGVESGTVAYEEELIDSDTRYNDRVMLSLRTREGLLLDSLSSAQRRYCLSQAQPYIDSGYLRLDSDGSRLCLSRRGIFVSDMVMSSLMIV